MATAMRQVLPGSDARAFGDCHLATYPESTLDFLRKVFMMAEARRAAPVDAENGEQVAELGTVAPARRATGGVVAPKTALRFVLAPLAIVSVVGLAAGLMFLPPSDAASDHTDPSGFSTAALGTSRDLARPELSPSPSPSASPSAKASPSVSPSAVASTPAATPATATPTPPPSPAGAAPAVEATPTPTPTPTPTVDYDELGDSAGTQYATGTVNVRTGPGRDFDTLTTLSEDDDVAVTDREIEGWRQVIIRKESGWVRATFLTKEEPAEPATTSRSSRSTGTSSSDSSASSDDSSDSGFSSASCPKAGNLESNVTARTAKVLRAVCAKFDGVSSYGGYRPGSGSYHGSGRAIDVMVSGEYGWEIARWARANASELGIIEVIYQQKIWTTQRSGDGWRSMSDRGSTSANHYDHVHLSIGG